MMSFRRLAAGAFAVALLAVPLAAMLFLTGCRKQEKMFIDTNLPPNTRLTSAPAPVPDPPEPPGPPVNYRIHMYWDGTDPDGFVVAYHYAWDDTVPPYGAENSPWQFTARSDSLFKALIDSVGQTKRHTFYVRAVDNEGKLDPSAAWVRSDASTAPERRGAAATAVWIAWESRPALPVRRSGSSSQAAAMFCRTFLNEGRPKRSSGGK